MRVSSTGVAASGHLPPGRAQLEVGEAQHLVGGGVDAAQQRAHAREQLLEREGLDDVVVRAGVEAGDAVADGVARGQHQHRAALLPVRRMCLQTSSPSIPGMSTSSTSASGWPFAPSRSIASEPVGRELDLVALELESPPQRLAYRPLVVDDHDLHGLHCAHVSHDHGSG